MSPVADAIVTPRLVLLPLTPSLLETVIRGDLTRSSGSSTLPSAPDGEQGDPAALRLRQLAADPSQQPWLVRAMVATAPRRVVGSVGVHAPPDDRGRVEIGSDVVAAERRQGHACEAIRALLACAWATRHASICVASVSPHNAPSLSLIESLAFQRVGEQLDEIDGLEWVFERRLPLS